MHYADVHGNNMRGANPIHLKVTGHSEQMENPGGGGGFRDCWRSCSRVPSGGGRENSFFVMKEVLRELLLQGFLP